MRNPFTKLHVLFTFLFGINYCASVSWSIDTELQQEFINGVSETQSRISQVSAAFTVTVTEKYVLFDKDKATEYFNKYKLNPNKLTKTTHRVTIHNGSMLHFETDKQNTESIKAANSEYTFILTRTATTPRYTVKSILSNEEVFSNSKYLSAYNDNKEETLSLPFRNYCYLSQPLHKLIRDPRFVYHNITEVVSDEKKYVRVDCEFPYPPQSRFVMRNAYFLCDPSNGWVVNEYGSDGPRANSRMNVVNTFGDVLNGLPTCKSSVVRHFVNGIESFTDEITFDVEISPDKVSPNDFTLSKFGLPEPDFNTPWISTWMKYLIAGLVCTGIAYWIKRRRVTAVE